ncbi:GNAT family N-acetyltransferase [Lacinutrix undariae]
MDILHTDNEKDGRFYIEIEGQKKAEMTYSYINAKKIDINHTKVDVSLKGKGIGYKLLEAAVVFMRKHHIKAVPTCSFVVAAFKKNETYADVISD